MKKLLILSLLFIIGCAQRQIHIGMDIREFNPNERGFPVTTTVRMTADTLILSTGLRDNEFSRYTEYTFVNNKLVLVSTPQYIAPIKIKTDNTIKINK